jgi:hypothetical protein
MLIASDESTDCSIKVVGATSILLKDFYEFESICTKLRIENNVLGEIKWANLHADGKYFDFYFNLIKHLFSFPTVRFHSNSFTGRQYQASYALVRSISWKLSNSKFNRDLHIIFDENGKSGFKEVEITKDMWSKDFNGRHKFAFCGQIDSKMFNILQATDLLAGCIAHKLNQDELTRKGMNNPIKTKFVEKVENEIDNGESCILSLNSLWKYMSPKKIQHFNLHTKTPSI